MARTGIPHAESPVQQGELQLVTLLIWVCGRIEVLAVAQGIDVGPPGSSSPSTKERSLGRGDRWAGAEGSTRPTAAM